MSRSKSRSERRKMVRMSRALLNSGGIGIGKTLSEFLVCPLSKQPLRFCEESNSLISDAIGVSFPIVDGIPCLVPQDGKIIESEETSQTHGAFDSSDAGYKSVRK